MDNDRLKALTEAQELEHNRVLDEVNKIISERIIDLELRCNVVFDKINIRLKMLESEI